MSNFLLHTVINDTAEWWFIQGKEKSDPSSPCPVSSRTTGFMKALCNRTHTYRYISHCSLQTLVAPCQAHAPSSLVPPLQDGLCAPSTALPDLGTGPRSLLTLPEHLEGKWCDSGWSGAGSVNKHCFCQGSAACGHPVLCLPSLQHSAWGSGHTFCFRALLFPFEGIPHMLISHQGSECLQSALWD